VYSDVFRSRSPQQKHLCEFGSSTFFNSSRFGLSSRRYRRHVRQAATPRARVPRHSTHTSEQAVLGRGSSGTTGHLCQCRSSSVHRPSRPVGAAASSTLLVAAQRYRYLGHVQTNRTASPCAQVSTASSRQRGQLITPVSRLLEKPVTNNMKLYFKPRGYIAIQKELNRGQTGEH